MKPHPKFMNGGGFGQAAPAPMKAAAGNDDYYYDNYEEEEAVAAAQYQPQPQAAAYNLDEDW